MLKIIIADDHKVFREGIVSILGEESNIMVLGQAENGNQVLDLLKKEQPDVILMDITMNKLNGIETTKKVVEEYGDVKILVLSMHDERDYIINVIKAGAHGYLLKDCGKVELIKAIEQVAQGKSYYSQEVSSTLIKQLTLPNSQKKEKEKTPLTNREKQVLQLIAEEYTNSEIAASLFISIRTVDTHRRNLIEKIGVKNTAGLVKYAIKIGLVE